MDSVAPYDTTFTPQFRLKIVGGKPIYVPDHKSGPDPLLPSLPTDRSSARDLPNQNHSESPAAGISSNHQQKNGLRSSAEKRNTLTSHSVLPPISPRVYSSNPTSNESNRWSAGDRGHGSHSSPSKIDSSPTNSLPREPITLEKAEELSLLQKLGTSLRNHTMEILKEIYNEISSNCDRNLTGWAPFPDVNATIQKCQVNLSAVDVQKASSQYVAVDRPGFVNYEKLLSFLASAIKLSNARKDTPHYFEPAKKEYSNLDFLSINTRPSRPANELSGAQGKLMRMVEEQLAMGDGPVDLVHLSNQFGLADRLHRDSLSHGEIKEICYRNRVPLQESVINHVLDRCRTTGDGQYRWSDFIEFLEKVQPVGTGLMITSKRPTEYVKHLPEPRDSWPHGDVGDAEPPSTYRNPRAHHKDTVSAPAKIPPAATKDFDTSTSQAPAGHVPSATHLHHNERVAVHSDAVQTDYQYPQQIQLNEAEGEETWIQRFGKLAQALYKNDLDKNGTVKADECRWLLTEYNDIYRLDFSKPFIDQTIQKHTTAGQGVSIDNLLKAMLQSVN